MITRHINTQRTPTSWVMFRKDFLKAILYHSAEKVKSRVNSINGWDESDQDGCLTEKLKRQHNIKKVLEHHGTFKNRQQSYTKIMDRHEANQTLLDFPAELRGDRRFKNHCKNRKLDIYDVVGLWIERVLDGIHFFYRGSQKGYRCGSFPQLLHGVRSARLCLTQY
jgi:hypothetical protein